MTHCSNLSSVYICPYMKTPNILRAAYFSDTFLFGKTITKPLTHICTSAVMKIKIYYVYAYQELFTLNEYTIFLDIDIVHDTYTQPLNLRKPLKVYDISLDMIIGKIFLN